MNALGNAGLVTTRPFGYWLAEGSGNAASAGAMSVGNATPGNSMPTSGTATYTSYTGGIYVETKCIVSIYGSRMTAVVDYAVGNRDLRHHRVGLSLLFPVEASRLSAFWTCTGHSLLYQAPINSTAR
jgi:hypothetical protein